MFKKMMVVLALTSVMGCQPPSQVPSSGAPTSEDDKTFYALGALLGKNVGVFSLSATELEMVKLGFTDQVTGKELVVKPEDRRAQIDELAGKRRDAQAGEEKKKAAVYLDQAAKEAGAKKLESGLVYTVMTEGTGASPTAADMVKVHYKGTLTDGTQFDSSYDRGEPAQFPLGGVIKCWTEGVQLMKVGGKSKLVCPSDIAYGDRGRPPKIPGGATLVFEVELMEIVSQAAPAEPAAPAAPATK